MNKKALAYLLLPVLISIFMTGCRENSSLESFEGNVDRENLEYYFYSDGSSSVSECFVIYKYQDQFIFVADYFECGNGLTETYVLSEEQIEGVLEELNTLSVEEASKETGDGGHSAYGGILVDDTYYRVGRIDFERLGIEVKDALDVVYPDEDMEKSFDIYGFKELQESDQWKKRLLNNGTWEFAEVIKEQAEAELGTVIDSMTFGELGDEDLSVELHTEDDKIYIATVTYRGYVADIKE